MTIFFAQMPQFANPGFRVWSEKYFNELEAFDIAADIEELERLGAKRQTLAVAMTLLKLSPSFDESFGALGKQKRERDRRKRLLLTPIPVLQDLKKLMGEMPPLPSQEFPDISRVITELKLLASILSWGEYICDALGANSLLEFSKFGLASFVREGTGNFLDRQVSNLTGAALGKYDYDENSHRVWRINNYKRLAENVPLITRFLVALNAVVPGEK